MGKAYSTELSELSHTYRWAIGHPLGPLQGFVNSAIGLPLIAIGSGGSTTAAQLAALLHRSTGTLARHESPLGVALGGPSLRGNAALLISASGRNRDILAALEQCISDEARTIGAICTRLGSPLTRRASTFDYAAVLETDPPSGKDGFLATNSLLATCVLLSRAYGSVLPPTIAADISTTAMPEHRSRSAALILHGGWSSPVAADLESKLNESGLAFAHVADYRNFGHGRHFGLFRRASESIVVALVTPETSELSRRTLALLPSDISTLELKTTFDNAAGTLDLLVRSFFLIDELAQIQGVDPGRPRVPDFGRKLFHLSVPLARVRPSTPVTRKLAAMPSARTFEPAMVEEALRDFTTSLDDLLIGGVVLDYDGTLCGRRERFGDLRADIATECGRLLDAGLALGVATGRGRSVRKALQGALPKHHWGQVIVGYYNGGEIAPLSDQHSPCRDPPQDGPLYAAYQRLASDQILGAVATVTGRCKQISVEAKSPVHDGALLAHVVTSLADLEHTASSFRVLSSSHSIDVIPAGPGKLNVVAAIKAQTAAAQVLSIGDRGAWPGNDFDLLSRWPSLSVDEVSTSLTTCWNLAPPGIRGADATLCYLKALCAVSPGRARIVSTDLWRSR